MSNAPADRRLERPALSLAPHDLFGPVDVVDFGARLRSAIREPMQIADEALERRPEHVAGAAGTCCSRTSRASARRSWRGRSPGAIEGRFSRVQATVDLLPTDILGATIWHAGTEKFEFHPGPVFANVVLVDELNRATPKTQSGLLEAMQELQVTVDGRSHPLERAVHGDRDAEPERRLRRHLPAAARAAGPLPRARVARLSRAPRRRSRCCASRRPAASSAPGRCASCSSAQAQVEEVRASEPLLAYVVARPGGDPHPPARRHRRQPARGAAAARRRARPRSPAGPRLRRRPTTSRRSPCRCSRIASSRSPPPAWRRSSRSSTDALRDVPAR